MLLEKAWAKLCGSYSKILNGTQIEAMGSLTGAPTKFYLHSEMIDVDLCIQKSLSKDFMITCSTSNVDK